MASYMFVSLFMGFLGLCCGLSECDSVNRASCRSIYSAQNCGHFTSCLKIWESSLWIKQKEDVSAECIFCMYGSRTSENLAFLNRLCDSSSKCPNNYRHVMSAIQTSSLSKNSSALCNVLDLCHSHVFLGSLNFGSPLCEDCKRIVTDIQKLIADNATSEAISNKLVQCFCGALPQTAKNYCEDVVKSHVPSVLRMIEIHLSPENICALIGLCPRPASLTLTLSDLMHTTYASESDHVIRSAVTHTICNGEFPSQRTVGLNAEGNPLETSTCQQCKRVLQWTFRTLIDPGFKARLENDLDENICSHFPYMTRLECIGVVSESFDGLLQIFDQADLDTVCVAFRMCPTVSTSMPLVDSLRVLRDSELSLPGVCHLCELAIDKLISLLIDKPTEEGIAAALDQVCNLLPSAYKTDCDNFVKNYGGKIVSAIIEGTAPKLICFSLGLCDSAYPARLTVSARSLNAQTSATNPGAHSRCNENARFSWIKRPSPKGHPKWTSRDRLTDGFVSLRDAPSCDQCVAVFQQASKSLNDPMVQAQLKVLIDDKVCSRLPSFLHVACATAINDHFDEIIQALQQVDTKEICSLTGMCSKSVTDLPPGTKRQTALSPGLPLPSTCVVCEIVTDKIISIALKNTTESSLASALDQVCGFVPQAYKSKCYGLVNTYGSEIVKAIIQGTAPKAICYILNLCGSDSTVFRTMDHAWTTQLGIELQSAPCEICKFVIQAVKYQLEQNATEARLDELVKSMCSELPQSYINECMNLVDTYLSTIIRYIEESMNAEEVCQKLGLCTSTNHPIDPAICLRGPALWFSNVPYAIICNAMRFRRSFTHQQRRSRVELEGLCRSRNLDHICSSSEMEHMCNRTNECILHRTNQYLQMVSKHVQHNDMSHVRSTPVVYNCTICELLLDRMRLHNRLFRRTIVSRSFCLEFEDTEDRKQCRGVMERKRELYDALRYETDTQNLCKSMSLCKPKPNEANKDNLSAFAIACASGPLFACSSRRNAEICGMTHLCNTLTWFSDEKWAGMPKRDNAVLDKFGQNVCTWGAVYWCQSPENARRCGSGAVKHCETRVWLKSIESVANKCSRGPSYYCRNPDTARSCGPHAMNLCRQRLLLQPTP